MDKQRKQVQPVVTSLPVSYVPRATLKNKSDAHNIALRSGKKKGACYVTENSDASGVLVIAIAEGPEPTDKWTLPDGTQITPA